MLSSFYLRMENFVYEAAVPSLELDREALGARLLQRRERELDVPELGLLQQNSEAKHLQSPSFRILQSTENFQVAIPHDQPAADPTKMYQLTWSSDHLMVMDECRGVSLCCQSGMVTTESAHE